MAKYSDQDPYLEPTLGILRNRLGITNEVELEAAEAAEAAFVAVRSYEIAQTAFKGRFDLEHLKA